MSTAWTNPNKLFRHSSFVIQRSALTLIEMLIGLAITLLMMAAVVSLFANIGSGVRVRQATIEMSGELRDVRTMLYNDLTHATCRATTWQRPDEDQGYIEIVEGSYSDWNPSALLDGNAANGEIDFALSQLPGSQITPSNQTTDGRGLGDYDDIIALTVRREIAPFTGRSIDPNTGNTTVVESSVAEVIWFAIENPVGGIEEPGIRTVYRRQLVVAPWFDFRGINSDPNLVPNMRSQLLVAESYRRYYLRSDISARIERTSSGLRWVPNTLGDLTKREYRFGHYYNYELDNTPNSPTQNQFVKVGFPHQFPYSTNGFLLSRRAGASDSSLQPLAGNREGEDFVIGNVLAFDVLVYDPGAPLFEYEDPPNSGNITIIEPSDSPLFRVPSIGVVDPANLVDFGAFVDLAWDDSYDYVPSDNYIGSGANQVGPLPSFQEGHRIGWHPVLGASGNLGPVRGYPAVYDTWSFHYEHDGLNQDLDLLEDGTTPRIDEGTNGLDDDNLNGVDDVGRLNFDNAGNPIYVPGERETSPPYDVPLRSIKVKLRIYEPNTRQAREVSVTASFVPQ